MLTPQKKLFTSRPYWLSAAFPKVPATPLKADKKTDIVIIGAGITGAMAAEELSSAGFKVILLDRDGPLKGSTSATTALLQYEIDQPLSLLQKQIGADIAARAWQRSKLGLESLAAKIQSLGMACNSKRVPSLYLAGNILPAEALKKECQLRNAIGLHTDYLTRHSLHEQYGIRRNAALRSFGNLTVNPLKMAAGFLLRALENGAEIFAPANADSVETTLQRVYVHTQEGHTITARFLIYATGYELPDCVPRKGHSFHSTYAIATKPQPEKLWPEKCLIWEASDPYLYLRTTTDGRVICGGEDENFENTEKRDALLARKTARLEKKLGGLFPQLDSRADYAWCGSFGASTTGLPTIGLIPGMPNCFSIMAYGGNGITFSRIAAEIITSQLTGKTDPDAGLFAFK